MKWTEVEIDFLKNNKHKSCRELAAMLGCSKSSVRNAFHKYRIYRSEEERSELISMNHFKKGEIHYRPPKGVRRSPGTEFRKGQLPKNTKYDGCISLRTETSGRLVVMIRTSQNKWMYLNRYNYIKEYGFIPPGWIVKHKDGDSLNCNIENLTAVPRVALLEKNRNRVKASLTRIFGKEHSKELSQIPEVMEFIKQKTELAKCLLK